MWTFMFLTATLVALTTTLVAAIHSMTFNSCENKDLFGARCQYKCHCAATSSGHTGNRCGADGECPNGGSCDLGWFGPACQYVDLAIDSVVTFANRTKLLELTDGDDQSCLTTPRIQAIHLKWTEPFIFRWLRIHVNNIDLVRDFSVRFRSNDSQLADCSNPRNATVNESSLDVYCDQEMPVRAVILKGRGVKALCSVYVSGGRNVAFLGNATQSSVFYGRDADKAVDGNRNGHYERGSCSHTDTGRPVATWNISFSQPQLINRILIYNRDDSHTERLQGFVLTATSDDGDNFSYRDQTGRTQKVYQLDFTANNTPISQVGIQAKNYVVLTLCEVEIYGDSVCPAGRYGRECEHTCNCTGQCLVSTGACPSPCDGEEDCLTSPGAISRQDDSLIAPIIGVAAVVFLVVVVAVTACICWNRRRYATSGSPLVAKGHEQIDNLNQEVQMDELAKSKLSQVGNSDETPVIPQTIKGDYYNWTPVAHPNSDTRIAVKDLDLFVSTHDTSFLQSQFASIPVNKEATMEVGQSSENKNKNRYKNICAYDHSRVHLQMGKNKKHGDYINASYVEGYQGEEIFIASQGPTKAILGDFIQMLWEQQVDKVVMLTNLVEAGQHKCERYWPEDGEIKLGEVTVKLGTTQVFADYTIRILQLSTKGAPVQTITQFHFTSWPDKDVPLAPWGLVDFEQRVASYPTTKPIVVHCSAGVGRTGTFIALRNLMRQAEDSGFVDVFTTVTMLRRSRVNMVQTAGQYEFLHRSVQVAILCLGTTVTSSDVKDRIRTISLASESGNTFMEHEFQAVSSICNLDDQQAENKPISQADHGDIVYENSLGVANLSKNRFSNILPKEYYSVILQSGADGAGDYINAVFVPSFTKQNQHILSQLPLPTTVVDLWKLVVQYKVTLIVAFEADLSETDQTIATYIPQAENDVMSFDQFIVRTEQVVSEKLWRQQEVVITGTPGRTRRKSSFRAEKETYVTHVQCTNSDLEPGNMLSVVKKVRSLAPAPTDRILYMCRNGADYCGLACILSLLLDRIDSDQRLTIPLVVGAIKAIRSQVIPTLAQYKLLYDVLSLYIDSISVYNNF